MAQQPSTTWELSATITYEDGSWKSVDAISDDSGYRMIMGTQADLLDVSFDPSFQQFLAYLGFPQSTGNPNPNVTDVAYRFHFQETNGHINVLSSTKHVIEGNAHTPAQIASINAALQSDPFFVQVIQATVGPPQILIQPTSQVVTEGQTATFSVTIVASNTPVTYRWFKNGIQISGATSRTYTTPATTLADNGASYKVWITNSAGTNSSANPGILTVDPAVSTNPKIILTISGLTGGRTYLGLGNGVHTIIPMTYVALPERWTRNIGPQQRLSLQVYPPTFSQTALNGHTRIYGIAKVGGITHSAKWYVSNFYSSTVYGGSDVSTSSLPFSTGYITNKIKDRSFGSVTSVSGVTITWQRDPSSWMNNPPTVPYTVAASASAGGTISPSGSVVVTGSQVFTIEPLVGYKISDVKVDGVSVGPVAHYTVVANRTIAATFAAETRPQMILTISGLPAGGTYLGFENGIHMVSPANYIAAPYEIWYKYNTHLAVKLSSDYLTLGAGATMSRNIFKLGAKPAITQSCINGVLFRTTTSQYTTSQRQYISYSTFPFTTGTPTAKVKNRAFGSVTTTTGVTVSWQRASNWPSNP